MTNGTRKSGKVVSFRLHTEILADLRTVENMNRFVESLISKEMDRRRRKGTTMMMSGFMMALVAGLLYLV